MSFSTDTETIERISERLANKLVNCHLKCNKEAEIAKLTTTVENSKGEIGEIKEAVGKIGEKIDKIEKHIVKSEAEKNTIMAVIGLVSAGIGSFFGGKI